MFSYVDPAVRAKLEKAGQLIYLNQSGEAVPPTYPEVPVVSLMGPIPLPVTVDGHEHLFHWSPFVRRVELTKVQTSANKVVNGSQEAFRQLVNEHMNVNSLLATPNFTSLEQPLVRIHSCCMTGDVFGSMRCECGPQLQTAFSRIIKEGGAVVYMGSHEGRGIGLWAKAATYLLQDQGQDTYQANRSLGLPEDSRNFRDAAVVLRHLLDGRPIRLLSNNPLKKEQMERYGQKVAAQLPHVTGINGHNRRYMAAKANKGHLLPKDL